MYNQIYMENEFTYSFGLNWVERFSICLYLAHSSVRTYRKDETKARAYVYVDVTVYTSNQNWKLSLSSGMRGQGFWSGHFHSQHGISCRGLDLKKPIFA
jgi:hypothetical protein